MSASDKKRIRKELAASQMTEKQKKAQSEAKKLRNQSLAFIALMLAVVIAAAGILGVRAVNNSGIIDKNTIAAITGNHKLNSVQMNYYFTDYVKGLYNEWSQTYGENVATYVKMMGLDINLPLDEQVADKTTGETWAQRFLQSALDQAKSDYALYDKAMAEGFTLTEEEEKSLNNTAEQLKMYATLYGYKNANKYLVAMYGYGSTAESYAEYSKISYIATAYYNKYVDSLEYSEEIIADHLKKNPLNYTSFSYASYYLSSSSFLTGGTTDENGTKTYTQAEKDAAVKAAEETAKKLAESKDVVELDKAIAALDINKNNKNAASTKSTDELYTNIPSMLQDWLSDDERKDGDITTIVNETTSKDADGKEVKTINGYYVVVFSGRNENTRPLANVRHLLVKFEGGKTNSSGVKEYTEAEKAKAKEEAEKYLKQWKDGTNPNEESFIELVKKHSDDTSAEDGGLFEDIHPASPYVPSFLAWSIDPERKPGDTGVIVSDYGYHVMYYSKDSDINYRDYMITEDLRAADSEKWYNGIVEAATITAENTKRLNLDGIIAYM